MGDYFGKYDVKTGQPVRDREKLAVAAPYRFLPFDVSMFFLQKENIGYNVNEITCVQDYLVYAEKTPVEKKAGLFHGIFRHYEHYPLFRLTAAIGASRHDEGVDIVTFDYLKPAEKSFYSVPANDRKMQRSNLHAASKLACCLAFTQCADMLYGKDKGKLLSFGTHYFSDDENDRESFYIEVDKNVPTETPHVEALMMDKPPLPGNLFAGYGIYCHLEENFMHNTAVWWNGNTALIVKVALKGEGTAGTEATVCNPT